MDVVTKMKTQDGFAVELYLFPCKFDAYIKISHEKGKKKGSRFSIRKIEEPIWFDSIVEIAPCLLKEELVRMFDGIINII